MLAGIKEQNLTLHTMFFDKGRRRSSRRKDMSVTGSILRQHPWHYSTVVVEQEPDNLAVGNALL